MTAAARTADHPIDPLFLERWSPRAFDRTAVTDADLMSLLEAARWAPSSYNVQPWRFIYAQRGTAHWEKLLDLLIPFNRGWAQDAGLILICLSETMMPPGPDGQQKTSHSHSFDAGAAWAQLALQAQRMGLAAHGMTGVDFDRAREVLALPTHLRIECAIAVGRRGDPAQLAAPLREREAPNGRNPVASFAFEGGLPAG
jgi:nitroreductase